MDRPRALALTHPKEPLVVLPRDVGEPGPGEVRLRLECCTLGQADWNLLTLDAPPRLPLVAGQEAVGRVEAVGEGVSLRVGQRLGVTPLATSCAACDLCERGLERYCPKSTWHGFHRDGGLATHGVFSAQHVVPLDDADDAAQAACWLGSGWAAMGALRTGGVGAGQSVVVFGVGGVGHLAVQLAKHVGARVWAVELDPARRQLAMDLGAEAGAPPLGADVALVCTPSTQAIQQAMRALRPSGVAVLVGSSPTGRFDANVAEVVHRGLSVRGSLVGSRADLLDVMTLGRSGTLRARVDVAALDEAVARLWWLRDGGFIGRLVFDCG